MSIQKLQHDSFGAPALATYHEIRSNFNAIADWLSKAIGQHDPAILSMLRPLRTRPPQHSTLGINPVNPNENTATDVSPGDTIVVAGSIFPGGTLKSGTQSNLPSDAGSVGQWVSRAVFLVNTSQLIGGVSPIADATMLYLLPNSSSSLVSEGLVPNVGSAEVRAVIGGTGSFLGASGEVRHENIGTNATGCFNYRFTFQVKTKATRVD